MEGTETRKLEDILDKFREVARQRFLTKEDHIDAAGAVSGHTNYPIVDHLRGESRKRYVRLFGDVDECNEFIKIHPQLRGVPKGMVRAIIDEKDPVVQVKAIEKLGLELIRGKALTVAQ